MEPKSLACEDCPCRFSRPSHLYRHRLTHIPRSLRDVKRCLRCDRTFARRDVLLRHIRAAHPGDQVVPAQTKRSCLRCAAKKLRCDLARPCGTCSKSRADCVFPHDGLVLGHENRIDDHFLTTYGEEQADLARSQDDCAITSPAIHMIERGMVPLDSNEVTSIQSVRMLDNVVQDTTLAYATPQVSPESQDCNSNHFDGPAYSLAQHDTGQSFLPSPFDVQNHSIIPGNTVSASDLNGLGLSQLDFRMSGFDWLEFDLAVRDQELLQFPHMTAQQAENDIQAIEQLSSLVFPSLHHSAQAVPSGTTPVSKVGEIHQPRQLWPFDHTKDLNPHQYSLPPLRHFLQSTKQGGSLEGNNYLECLVQLLSEKQLPTMMQITSAGTGEAFNDIQRFSNLYFDRFHDIQAIIHRPTWDIESCSTVLITAMACVGALLSHSHRDQELSKSLSDLCLPMLTCLGASDPANYNDISYLNALCLHQIYSLGSGSRQLYQNADRSRGALIGSLRGIGLLNASWSVEGTDEEASEASCRGKDDTICLEQEWVSWVRREQARRAAWAAFEYDCSLCTLTSRRGAVDLGELPPRLPCIEALWNAASAPAWFALRSRMSLFSSSPHLSVVLKAALAGNEIPPALGSWAKRLTGQVLGRLLWDIKQLEAVVVPYGLGLSCLPSAHTESKRSILRALSTLLSSVSNPTSSVELITYNITGLLCHYSHLYAAEDIMDAVVFIVRNATIIESNDRESLKKARRHLAMAFSKDQRAGRALLWHACQIVAIAREYLVSAPCEIMRLFMGYTFIMSYAAFSPQLTPGQREIEALRLDVPNHQIRQRQMVTEWIQNGGPARVGSVEIIGVGRAAIPELTHDARTMMQSLKGWGLSERFAKILDILGTRGL